MLKSYLRKNNVQYMFAFSVVLNIYNIEHNHELVSKIALTNMSMI